MRHLVMIVICLTTLTLVRHAAASHLSQPLESMDVVQHFGGTGGTHLGTDLDGAAGEAVFSVADGQVFYFKGDAGAYGGGSGECARDGEVLFIRHRKANGDYFIAQYGHIQNVPEEFRQVTTFDFDGPFVRQGEKIAEIGVYTPKRDCSTGRADHLHFGIWDSNNQIPTGYWGYYSNTCWTTPSGCWVDPIEFLSNESPYAIVVSSLFDQAWQRNGSAAMVGYPTAAGIYCYGPFLRKDYSGGSYGDCCILYDPNNAWGNPDATDEAYLLRTGFLQYYESPERGGSASGCPTRDEYHPESGDEGDAIQFFIRRVFNANTETYEIQFHYMYFEANLPANEPPDEVISWHSTYATEYVSQNPAGQFTMQRGETRTFTVQFRNSGTTSWRNNASSFPYDYVELKSCDGSGTVVGSFLYDNSWLNVESPCTMQQSTVAPSATATFTFTGKVATDAPLGLKQVYFRVNHSTSDLLDDWGGMHFQVNVTNPAFSDLACFYDYSDNRTKIYPWLTDGYDHEFMYQQGAWWDTTGYDAPTIEWAAAGDFDDDGLTDLASLYDYPGTQAKIHTFLSTGTSFDYQGSAGWWSVASGYNTDSVVGFVSVDVTNNGRDDLAAMYHYPGTGARIHIWASTGSSFSYQGPSGWWSVESGYDTYKVVAMLGGDFDGDGYKDDIATIYDYGYIPSIDKYRIRIHVWLSTGTTLNWQSSTGWVTVDGYPAQNIIKAVAGDFDGNGKDDIATVYDYGSGETGIHMFLSTGSAFQYQGSDGWWRSTGYTATMVKQAQAGYFDEDNKEDLVLAYRYSTCETHLHVFLSTGSYFDYQNANGWWASDGFCLNKTYFLLSGRFYDYSNGVPKTTVADKSPIVPEQFTLNQNYPNPFNPVTVISYTLPTASGVRLDVFNVLGQRVETLVDTYQAAGEHSVLWNSRDYPSGVYFYRLAMNGSVETKKMILLK